MTDLATEFQRAVKVARKRMADPTWGAEYLTARAPADDTMLATMAVAVALSDRERRRGKHEHRGRCPPGRPCWNAEAVPAVTS